MASVATAIMALPTQKPRIGFSIESIVGSQSPRKPPKLKPSPPPPPPPPHFSPGSESSELPLSPASDAGPAAGFPADTHSLLFRGHPPSEGGHFLHLPPYQRQYAREFQSLGHRMEPSGAASSGTPPLELNVRRVADINRCSSVDSSSRRSPTRETRESRDRDTSELRMIDLSSNSSRSPPPGETRLSPEPNQAGRSPGRSSTSPGLPRGPIIVPGVPASLVRPYPIGANAGSELKSLPPFMGNTAEALQAVQAAHNQHFLAAQFQAAAALAHVQAHGQAGFHGHPAHLQHHPHHQQPHHHHHHHHHHPHHPGHPGGIPRDSYPLYPWLLSRHGRNVFPPRFPGNYLLPFRKPKRVRTAFSPSQLLKLEHAFENNHYVVGAERKTLAQALSLTETQVKVWFQNRRTKHKRMQQEEDAKSGGNADGSGSGRHSPGSPGGNYEDEDEDELIDMEMDDECPSDEDEPDRG